MIQKTVVALLIALLAPFQLIAKAVLIDGVYLVVNSHMMTRSEALDTAASLKNRIAQSNLPDAEKKQRLAELQNQLLQNLVKELLIQDRAQALRLTPSETEIESRMDQLLESQPNLLDLFTEEDIHLQLIRDLKKQRVISREIESRIRTDEKEIQDYCVQSTRRNRSIGLAQILFRGSLEDAQAKAAKVALEFNSGKPFAELAEQYSEDPGVSRNLGKLGYFKTGELLPAIDRVAFALKKGELSELVITEFGHHLLMIFDEKMPAGVNCSELTLQQKNSYADAVYGRLRDAMLEEYLEELWVCARIEVKHPAESGLPGPETLPEITRDDVRCRVRSGALQERAAQVRRQKENQRPPSR